MQRTPGGFVLSLISDQHHGHIVDIRAGRAGDDEPIHRLEGHGRHRCSAAHRTPSAGSAPVPRPCCRPHSRPQHRLGRRCHRCPPKRPLHPARRSPMLQQGPAPDCARPDLFRSGGRPSHRLQERPAFCPAPRGCGLWNQGSCQPPALHSRACRSRSPAHSPAPGRRWLLRCTAPARCR